MAIRWIDEDNKQKEYLKTIFKKDLEKDLNVKTKENVSHTSGDFAYVVEYGSPYSGDAYEIEGVFLSYSSANSYVDKQVADGFSKNHYHITKYPLHR